LKGHGFSRAAKAHIVYSPSGHLAREDSHPQTDVDTQNNGRARFVSGHGLQPCRQWTGKTVANLFADELQQIIRDGSGFHGERFSSKRQYKQVPDLPKIPIETNFELQFEGLSLKQVISAWDYLRYDQQLFSGDVILNHDDTLTVRARVASDKQAMYWEVGELDERKKIPKTEDGLKKALARLAIQVFTSLNPETMGRYFLQSGNFEDAQKVFEQWARREPTRPQPFFYLAYAYDGNSSTPGQLELGRRAAEQALGNDSSYYLAIGEIAWTLEHEAENAMQADRPQKFGEAISKYKEAIRASHKWWRFWSKGPPNYWNNLCAAYRDTGLFDEAEDACHKALGSDPDLVVATANLGRIYEKRAELPARSSTAAEQYLGAAEKAYRQALRQRPDYFEALADLRRVFLISPGNRHAVAINVCERWAAAFPWAAEPLTELGQVYEAEDDLPRAIDYYQLATKRDPKNPIGWSALANAEFNHGSYARASESARRALELRQDPFTLAPLGEALAAQGLSSEEPGLSAED
jgi:tetratricopeptide (TPR) repeat protein